jgi:hypothetical protein
VPRGRSQDRCSPNNRHPILREKLKLLPTIALSAAIAVIGAGAGCARTPMTTTVGTAAPKPAATTAARPTRGEKAVISKACAEQADAKSLHGKERKNFRAECMRKGGKPS